MKDSCIELGMVAARYATVDVVYIIGDVVGNRQWKEGISSNTNLLLGHS